MKISVYDTYVPLKSGKTMHFDILVNENTTVDKVYSYGNTYLKSKEIDNYKLTMKECQFCHIEKASESLEREILEKDFYIIEMENCHF
ncbi:protein of unknown function [Tenacibaculum sp. MAR_2009_124]|uniref:DUF2024 family protein n=1 Tax=Tenacibaculum sp. MAR_2009_124 TaxID=1250059 RepID=UPI00089B2071|nr:DUF2024 family protein [Tenacibaculum sp. MAR_2009_124]SEB71214.1 protein of unknown function [Tenacibaculum sp. MAR_2009_124]